MADITTINLAGTETQFTTIQIGQEICVDTNGAVANAGYGFLNALNEFLFGDEFEEISNDGDEYCFKPACDLAPGTYKIRATEVGNPSNVYTQNFTVTALANITVGTPDNPGVGQQTQFETTETGVAWGIAGNPSSEINESTGLATWQSLGTKDVTYTKNGCVKHLNYEVTIMAALAIDNEIVEGSDCLATFVGDDPTEIQVSGGSEDPLNLRFETTNGNYISSDGMFTPLFGGRATVSVRDVETSELVTIEICVSAQNACIKTLPCSEEAAQVECCEIVTELGESVCIVAESFLVDIEGVTGGLRVPTFSSLTNFVLNNAAFAELQSTNADGFALGDIIPPAKSGIFRVVAQGDLADTSAGEVTIGWKDPSGDFLGVLFKTESGDRKVEITLNGAAESASEFVITEGSEIALRANRATNKYELLIDSILVFSSDAPMATGNLTLQVHSELQGTTIGGQVVISSASVISGEGSVFVSSINNEVTFSQPDDGFAGVTIVELVAGNFVKRVSIRAVKPTYKTEELSDQQYGAEADVYITDCLRYDSAPIRLAKDGSPDSSQINWTWLGRFDEDGVTQAFEETVNQYTDDRGGQTQSSVRIAATITGNMLSVNSNEKLRKVFDGYKRISNNHYGIGSTGVKTPKRVLVVYRLGNSNNSFVAVEYHEVYIATNFNLQIARTQRSVIPLSMGASENRVKFPNNSLASKWVISDCSKSNAQGCGQ